MTKAVLIYNARLLDEAMDTPGAILLTDGTIRAVFQGYFTDKETISQIAKSVLAEDGVDSSARIEYYDASGYTVTPAFIDMHVHMRYPGQTAKEDLNSGLHATAAGGFGTVIAMPNTNPVISSYEMALQVEKEACAIGLTHLFQTVSITKDFEGLDINHLHFIEKKNIPVITEDGHDVLSSAVMLEGMKIAGEKDIIVSCHSEDPTLALEARPFRQNALKIMKEVGLSAWGGSLAETKVSEEAIAEIDANLTQANKLLALAEDIATDRNIQIAEQAKCHVHIAHCSTENSMNSVRRAKEKGLRVTAEVTPHHLALTGVTEPNIRALVNPPLRTEKDRKALIEALRDGTADVISTDHAPHTFDDKAAGSPGFTGSETAFAVCNTVLVKENDFSLNKLSQLMAGNPGRILGLQKGLLKPGYDADLTFIDPDEEWTVDSRLFYSKGKATPFEGKKLYGTIKALFIDGRKVLER